MYKPFLSQQSNLIPDLRLLVSGPCLAHNGKNFFFHCISDKECSQCPIAKKSIGKKVTDFCPGDENFVPTKNCTFEILCQRKFLRIKVKI